MDNLGVRKGQDAQCPLLAISGHTEGSSRTSALPPKADIQIMIPGQAPADVRLTPESGRKWVWRWMSAYEHPAGNWKRESGIGLGFFGQGSIL